MEAQRGRCPPLLALPLMKSTSEIMFVTELRKHIGVTGPKISQNVNYTQRGTMEGPKAPSEARRRRSPSPVWGSVKF